MKGCLKQPSPIPSPALPDCPLSRKCVAFEAEGSERIFFADEWDRTPTEPTRLSYQDLMELREIQRSLPLANQPPDPITGRPGRHYLSNVPIALLPLLPSNDSAGQGHGSGVSALNGVHSGGHSSPNHHGVNGNNGTTHGQGLQGFSARTTPHRKLTAAANNSRSAPSKHWSAPPGLRNYKNNDSDNYLHISKPIAQRPKPNFAFLPLLDTPASSSESSSQSTTPSPSNPSSRSTTPEPTSDTDHTDPPTPSLTNASLDSPISCASSLASLSPEPTFLQLPPKHLSCLNHGNGVTVDLHFGPTDSYFPPQAGESDADVEDYLSRHRYDHHPVRRSSGDSEESRTPPSTPLDKPPRKRNVIVVNEVEIDLGGDEEEEEVQPAPASPPPPVKRKKNIIIVNGEEVELDDDEDEEPPTPVLVPADEAPSIHCNSTENLKPPENKTGDEKKAHSSFSFPSSSSHSPYSSSQAVPSTCSTPLRTSSAVPNRTTVDYGTSYKRSNLGSTSDGASNTGLSTTGLGLKLEPGSASDIGFGIGRMGPGAEPSVGSSATSSTLSVTSTTVTGYPCPTGAAPGFGSLHMPLRFKRRSAANITVNCISNDITVKMASTDALIS